jgi:hypothetical protein
VAVLTINRGLVTSPNELTRPDGAATVLDNCNIDSDNVVESRRGFGEFGNATELEAVVKQLITYKGRIIRHFSDKLSFDSTGNGNFLNFSGSYSELVDRLRIKYFELNSNLYFTTNEGIKKISATSADDFTVNSGYITNAGGVKAVGLEGRIVPSESGFLPAQSKVAYKVLWAKKDANGNIIRGVPSSRYIVTNTTVDINKGESFSVAITTAGAGIHKSLNSTTSLSDGVQTTFLAAAVNITDNTIALTSGATDHNYQTNDLVKLSASTYTLPTGLTAGNYYIIRVDTNKVKLKTALDGTAVDITATGTGGVIESTNVGKTITSSLHGYANNTKVRVFGDIPTELNKDTFYYVVNATTNTFELSLSSGGTALFLTKKEGTFNVYSGLSNVNYLTFDTPTNKYAAWFNISGQDSAPTNAGLVGRDMLEVNISTLAAKTKEGYVAKLAEVLFTVTDITTDIDVDSLTVTNSDGGNVLNASRDSESTTFLTVPDVIDGQTALGTPANVNLTVLVPADINSKDYFFELYRTAAVTVQIGVELNDIDPGEEFQKIYEAPVAEGSNPIPSEIPVEDYLSESFREGGAYLYINPVSGEGILQANEAPPIAHDVAVFKGSAFYANTKERHRLQLTMLSVSRYTSGTSKLYIGNSTKFSTYTFVGRKQVLKFTAKKPSETKKGSYFDVYSAQDRVKYRVWFNKGTLTYSFDDSEINENEIAILNHELETNDLVTISGTSLPAGLTAKNYYAIRVDSNTIKLSNTINGSAIDLTGAIGTATLSHTTVQPPQDSCVLLKVNIQKAVTDLVLDTVQYSVDAFIDAFFDIFDFEVEDLGSGIIQLTNTDNGESSLTTQSSPATGWINPEIFVIGLGEDASQNKVLLSGLSSEGQSTEDTARSLERVINKDPNSPVNAFYLSGPTDFPGILLLESRSMVDDAFYLAFSEEYFNEALNPVAVFEPSLPIAKIVTSVTSASPEAIFTTTSSHGFAVGQQVYAYIKPASIPAILSAKKIVSNIFSPAVNTFSLSGFTSITYSSFDTALVFPADVVSDNSVNPNRVYFSKIQQPEAVPLVNYIDIGPKDKKIQRILALRDSLVVLKEDGVYIISGSAAPNFSVRLSDSSALTYAPDTATNLNNLIYVLTSQGVVTVSETGVGVISRNIENKIQEIANAKFNYKLMSWGMASESDRCYLLWLPERVGDDYATQAFRYNTFTRTWTRWTKPANCGVVNPLDDKIYLGDSSGRPYVLQERKNFERQDYADREITRSVGSNAISGISITLSSVAELESGDVLTQKQYVDINKFNRLLKKLDRDGFSTNPIKYITLKAAAGNSLGAKLVELVTKLQSDGVSFALPSGSDNYITLRNEFNALVDYLNGIASPTNFKNYKQAQDLLTYEILITAVDQKNNTIQVKFINKFVQGDVVIFKSIKCLVEYAPQHFGKPETTKQVSEGTFIFDQNNFWGGTIAYSSDRSFDFKSVNFSGKGPGYWDGYNWANVTFGGEGNEVPVRTLVPMDKARCRYLHVQFRHGNAREQWKLIGVSLEPREVSTRGYR